MKPGDLVRYHPLLSPPAMPPEHDTEAVGLVTEIHNNDGDVGFARVLWSWGLSWCRIAALRLAEVIREAG